MPLETASRAIASPTPTAPDEPVQLSQASLVGQGVDITGTTDLQQSLITPLLDPVGAGTQTIEFLGQRFTIPNYVSFAQDTHGSSVEDTVTTRDSFQSSIAASAGVEVGIGAFSGQMEASYSRQFAESSSFFYSYRNFESRLGVLTLDLGEARRHLSSQFQDRLDELPDEVTEDNLQAFRDFYDDFGFYFSSVVNLGASLEYYVAINTATSSTTEEISASVKAEYKALFYSGSVSASVKESETWQSYSENRTVSILGRGGDVSLLAKISNVDPENPGQDTVDLYNAWADSIASGPAVGRFRLMGLWNLGGEKEDVLFEAFERIRETLNPLMVLETSNQAEELPFLVLDRRISPETPPGGARGFQVVVLDRRSPSAEGVVYDRFFSVPKDADYEEDYVPMYDRMAEDLREFQSRDYFVIFASFGISSNAPPTDALQGFLVGAGAGDGLARFIDFADPGSNIEAWPAIYTLVGVPGSGLGGGVEFFTGGTRDESNRQVIRFYRQRGSSRYTAGLVSRGDGVRDLRREFRVAGKSQSILAILSQPETDFSYRLGGA